MAEQITIYQTQSVVFTDITIGGIEPYERTWSLEGADINTATGATAIGVYNSPGDYTVYLTVTDYNGVTDDTRKANLVSVLPATITASFTKSATAIGMSEVINFTDTSTGSFINPTAWNWGIGDSGFTSQNVTNFKLDDWINVQGADIADPPGYSRQVTAQLTASNGLIQDTTHQTFNMSKVGPQETVYINGDGGTPLIEASSVSMSTYTGSDVSLPLDNRIFEIGIGDLGGSSQEIANFHSTNEVCTLYSTGLAGSDTFITGVESVAGILVINKILYGSGNTAIDSGYYVTPGLKNSIFFMDTGNITELINTHNWSRELLEDVIGSQYPLLHSAQAYAMGGEYQRNPDDSTASNPIIPSPEYFTSHGHGGYKYTLTMTITENGSPIVMNIDFDANGGYGNYSAGGLFYVMQNSGGGPAGVTGVAEMINTAIANSASAGGTAYVEAYTSSLYTAHVTSASDDYNGIAMKIKNTRVSKIEFQDNSDILNGLGLPDVILPFGASDGSFNSCTGMPTILDTAGLDYLPRGTRINYGGAIY